MHSRLYVDRVVIQKSIPNIVPSLLFCLNPSVLYVDPFLIYVVNASYNIFDFCLLLSA